MTSTERNYSGRGRQSKVRKSERLIVSVPMPPDGEPEYMRCRLLPSGRWLCQFEAGGRPFELTARALFRGHQAICIAAMEQLTEVPVWRGRRQFWRIPAND